jgi:lipopolysaccharide cholinephosphotransferase
MFNERILIDLNKSISVLTLKDWKEMRNTVLPFSQDFSTVISRNNFVAFANILSQNGLSYWITNGTLLGIIRDGDLIAWDEDADFDCYPIVDISILKSLISDLIHNGYTLVFDTSLSLIKFNAFKDGNKFSFGEQLYFAKWLVSNNVHTPYDLIGTPEERKIAMYRNNEIPIPANPEDLLQYYYKDWRKPSRSADFRDFSRKECLNGRFIQFLVRTFLYFRISRRIRLRKLILSV